ncbi:MULTISPECIES: response regulator transcription factor [unclassified Aquitalea]|jgi:FixJ family two-component response regulator|uniref:response regulator transcription factor n=1 Tax=unclassified Aquitalea TaxID=2628611 RepID=UPI00103AD637|nr:MULTISPECIES: response regulator [unclassified Aquitalea]QBJ78247.1 DNA-binding response regulator [Aquitalea sp. USM4]
MKEMPLTLFVVDDDEALRRSLLLLLLSQGLAVQAFDSGEAFLSAVNLRQPGCVILDLRLGGISGLSVFDSLLAAHSPLVTLFLSAHGDIPTALEAVRRGAFDWVEKPDTQQLLDKLPAAIALARARAQALRQWAELTPREREVARLVGLGQPNKEIARVLVPPCGHRSVETHRANIFSKLQCANDNELGRWLAAHPWLD